MRAPLTPPLAPSAQIQLVFSDSFMFVSRAVLCQKLSIKDKLIEVRLRFFVQARRNALSFRVFQ